MLNRGSTYFFIFLFFSVLIFLFSRFNLLQGPQSFLSKAALTVSSPVFFLNDFIVRSFGNSTQKLRDENLNLQRKLVDSRILIDENKALHDQFQVVYPRSLDLLPSKILGSSRFIPGIFSPETFVIDRGSGDGVKTGNAVLVKNNLVGKISKTTEFLSEVILTTNSSLKFAAKTANNVRGIVRGEGNGDLIFDNVLLSDHLSTGDLVLTLGDLKLDQTGFPSDLIVGQIVSVDSNASDLFQRAKLKTLIDFSKSSEVFVFKGLK